VRFFSPLYFLSKFVCSTPILHPVHAGTSHPHFFTILNTTSQGLNGPSVQNSLRKGREPDLCFFHTAEHRYFIGALFFPLLCSPGVSLSFDTLLSLIMERLFFHGRSFCMAAFRLVTIRIATPYVFLFLFMMLTLPSLVIFAFRSNYSEFLSIRSFFFYALDRAIMTGSLLFFFPPIARRSVSSELLFHEGTNRPME